MHKMTIFKKVSIILGIVSIAIIGMIILITRFIILDRFSLIENQTIEKDSTRLNDSINSYLTALSRSATDYGEWDDMYQFMADQNQNFKDNNLNESVLANMGYNLWLLVDSQSQIVYSSAYNVTDQKSVPLPAGIQALITGSSPLMEVNPTQPTKTGFINLDGKPLLFSSNAILTSSRQGPSRGVIIFARYLDDGEVDSLANLTQMTLEMKPVSDSSLPIDYQEAQKEFTSGKVTYIKAENLQTINSYRLFTDVSGNPSVIFKMTFPRDLFNQGLNSIITFLLLLGLGVLIIAIPVFYFFFYKQMLVPIKEIGIAADILSTGDLNVEIQYQSNDEIGMTADSMRKMISNWSKLSEVAKEVTKGNLAVNVTPISDKDLLGNAFSKMVNSFRQTIQTLETNANRLLNSSAELAKTSELNKTTISQVVTTIQQVAKGSAQQSENLADTAASVEQTTRSINGIAKGAQEQALAVDKASNITVEISDAIRQLTDSVNSVSKNSEDTASTARDGAKIVRNTIEGMEIIREKVGHSSEKVQQMGVESEKIGMIVETIQDLASQTNLLALNAAIEAARAGESGKGFAVVADEVRKLAERSATAAKSISDLVSTIQKSVDEAVSKMGEGSREVENGVERSKQAGKALSDILAATETVSTQAHQASEAARKVIESSNTLVSAVDSVSAVVEENRAAAEEMTVSSSEVNSTIDNIASVSEQNSASVEEVSAAAVEIETEIQVVADSAKELSEMARDLHHLVAQYKIN